MHACEWSEHCTEYNLMYNFMPIYKLVSIYLSGKKITDFTLNTRQQCYEKFNCNSRLEGRLVENTQEIGENGHFSRTCTNIGKDKL